jgi:hypothetical protein
MLHFSFVLEARADTEDEDNNSENDDPDMEPDVDATQPSLTYGCHGNDVSPRDLVRFELCTLPRAEIYPLASRGHLQCLPPSYPTHPM